MRLIHWIFPRREKQYHYFIPFVSVKDGEKSFGHVVRTTKRPIKSYAVVKKIEKDLASEYKADFLTITAYPHLIRVDK